MTKEIIVNNILAPIFSVIVAVIILAILYEGLFGHRKKIKKLALALGGKVVNTTLKDVITGNFPRQKSNFASEPFVRLSNYEAEVRVYTAMMGKQTPPYLGVVWVKARQFGLHITWKGAVSRALLRWHLIEPVNTGHPYLDGNFLIKSDDPLLATGSFQNPEFCQAVQYFFDNGFDEISTHKSFIAAFKPRYNSNDLDPATVHSYIEKLRVLALT